jgi:hypothetical protein
MFYVPANPRPTVEFPRPEPSSKIEFTLFPGFPADNPLSKVDLTFKGFQLNILEHTTMKWLLRHSRSLSTRVLRR